MIPRVSRVRWTRTHRLIRSKYPPIDLFEDIADPADWELIASAEAKTNPRVRDSIGAIQLVPPRRRVSGPGATMAMAPFCHVSRDRPTRFSDGSYGVYYAGDRFEVALYETVYHFERFMGATGEDPSSADYRELIGRLDARLHDLRNDANFVSCFDPDNYAVSQSLAKRLRDRSNSNGLVYRSVRYPQGNAVAVFWPNVAGIPHQARHLRYRWNGERMDGFLVYGEDDWRPFP